MKLQFTLARLLQDKTFEIGVPCQLRECAHIYIEFSMVYTLGKLGLSQVLNVYHSAKDIPSEGKIRGFSFDLPTKYL